MRFISPALFGGLVAAIVVAAPNAGGQTAPATSTTPTASTVVVSKAKPKPCSASQRKFRTYARKVYERSRISRSALRRLDKLRACARSRKAAKNMLRYQKEQSVDRRFRRIVNSLTPYPGPNGTRWAIPYYIVACESHGNWNAYNPSGARGAYQFLGWNVPWPVRSEADKVAHHRMAARLWAGGRGASHWVCA